MDNILYKRFDYRFEKQLSTKLKKFSKISSINRNEIVRMSLAVAIEQYRQGKMHFLMHSDFLIREEKDDLVRYQVILDIESREILRQIAFTVRLSQAEVLRLAMEYYLYVELDIEKSQVQKKYRIKFSYDKPVKAISLVLYEVSRVKVQKITSFHDPPPYKLHLGKAV